MNWFKKKSVIPGFGLSLGFTLTYMSLIILLPLAATFVKTSELSWGEFWSAVTSERVVGSYKITFGTSLAAALFNVPCGVTPAWVLARYKFPGRRLVDALVDLPFALPTAVAGDRADHALCDQRFGRQAAGAARHQGGLHAARHLGGFDIHWAAVRGAHRAANPVRAGAGDRGGLRHAGRTRLQTIRRVVFPGLLPSIITGFTLAFARAIGEYGSVAFIWATCPCAPRSRPC